MINYGFTKEIDASFEEILDKVSNELKKVSNELKKKVLVF
jgi:hypothetical protein